MKLRYVFEFILWSAIGFGLQFWPILNILLFYFNILNESCGHGLLTI